jgi:hypothetical protein
MMLCLLNQGVPQHFAIRQRSSKARSQPTPRATGTIVPAKALSSGENKILPGIGILLQMKCTRQQRKKSVWWEMKR